MKRSLEQVLTEIKRRKNRPALMTHVVLGYPSLQESLEVVKIMAAHGAEIIELQIPFSDPYGDGPTITRANTVALANGVTPKDCMRAMRKLSRTVSVPLLFMSYFNPVLSYRGGVKGFCEEAARAGAQGLIIPDVPPEEVGEGYWSHAKEYGLAPIPLVSPTTSRDRLKRISRAAGKAGFVYCVSTTAVTGARAKLPKELPSYLRRVRRHFKVPRAVGFGISKPQHIHALRGHTEIAIVGSATIDLIARTPAHKRRQKLAQFVASLVR